MAKIEQNDANTLIPKLIEKFTNFTNNMKDRVKINSIFSEFEDKAVKELRGLIKISSMRYKGVKSGNSLENILSQNKHVYTQIADRIINDVFYSTPEIPIEKEKLKIKTDKEKNNEINLLRKKITESSKSFTKRELQFRKEVSDRIDAEKKKNENKKKKKEETIFKEGESTCSLPTSRVVPNKEQKISVRRRSSASLEKILEPHPYFLKMLGDDEGKFKDSMNSYQGFLTELRYSYNEGDLMKINKKMNFLNEDLKMLNYKQRSSLNVVTKKDENSKVDIPKIMKFTKRGKIAKKNEDANSSEQPQNEKEEKESAINILPQLAYISDYGNTIQIVKAEAGNSLYIDELFSKKRNALDSSLKKFELPRIEDYEKIIKRNTTSQKLTQHGILSKEQNVQGDANIIKKESDFKKAYEEKQAKWKQEDQEKENEAVLDKEHKKENALFLSQTKNRARVIQPFIDQYSLRDGKTNQNLFELNRALGRISYDKNTLSQKIQEFSAKKEKIEKDRLEKEKLKTERILDLELKKQRQVAETIKNNLKNEDQSLERTFHFGEKENKIVKKIPIKKKVKNEVDYNQFLYFKNKVLEDERIQNEKELSRSYENPTISARNSILCLDLMPNNKNILNATPVEIMEKIKGQTQPLLKKKVSLTDKALIEVRKEKPLGVKSTYARSGSLVQIIADQVIQENKQKGENDIELGDADHEKREES